MKRLILFIAGLCCMAAFVAPAAASAATLLGDTSLEPTGDGNQSGQAQAWPYTATASGTTGSITFYLNRGNGASKAFVGLYSDASGHPGSLLTSGSTTSMKRGWVTVAVGAASVTSGTHYWLAILGNSGWVAFRDRGQNTCQSAGTAAKNLSTLPASWGSSITWPSCPGSIYLNGTTTTGGTSAPSNTSRPTITGTAQQGQTLTTSHGAWTGSPTSYAYQWQRCASSCSNISGATGVTYAVQSSDVGDTIDVVVTATNAAGSGQATSAKTATVTASPPPAAPSNTSVPTITGTAQQGQTLTASHGAWTGSPTSYAYQWQRCASSCSNISGATGTTYAVQSSDVGDTIDVVVTATNASGSGHATSAKTATVTASSPPPPPPPPPPSNGLHVSGNKLLDANGTAVVLRGVDRAGTEYMCAQGNGITDGPSGSSEFAPMVSWKINSVFIGLNEDCWLGINGVKSQYGGQNYINAIKAEVSAAEANGLFPVVAFFWGDPGSELANSSDDPNGGGQPALPDNDHAPLFWEEVADTFKSDPNVIFRLQEEPHPAGNSSGSSAWTCWSQGDVQYSPSSVNAFGTAPTPTGNVSHCNEKSTNNSISYSTVGMQSLLNIIRGTGATNVVQVPGVQYANMMACTTGGSPTSCGFLQPGVRVTDTLATPQLMADVDVYPDYNPCNSTSCYSATYGPVIAQMPFEAGETGIQSNTTKVDQFLSWMDTQNSGYYAWAWDTWAGLIEQLQRHRGEPVGHRLQGASRLGSRLGRYEPGDSLPGGNRPPAPRPPATARSGGEQG